MVAGRAKPSVLARPEAVLVRGWSSLIRLTTPRCRFRSRSLRQGAVRLPSSVWSGAGAARKSRYCRSRRSLSGSSSRRCSRAVESVTGAPPASTSRHPSGFGFKLDTTSFYFAAGSSGVLATLVRSHLLRCSTGRSFVAIRRTFRRVAPSMCTSTCRATRRPPFRRSSAALPVCRRASMSHIWHYNLARHSPAQRSTCSDDRDRRRWGRCMHGGSRARSACHHDAGRGDCAGVKYLFPARGAAPGWQGFVYGPF